MYKTLLLICAFLTFHLVHFANDYDKAWEALRKNDRKQAIAYLEKALKDPVTATDAYITSIFLKEFGGGKIVNDRFSEMVMDKVKDVNPYLFAMWFNDAVLGQYGRKTIKDQLDLLDQISKRNDINGSLKSASKYVLGMHFLNSNQFEKARPEWQKMGALGDWQLVGPFENLSGSGFHKSYGPLEHAEATADFKSSGNAIIHWFRPARLNEDGWIFLQSHIADNTAITYAQTFVYAPEDMKAVINAGVNGSLKVWVNDLLVIAEAKERVTELDCYKSYAQLKKGYNRILVQTGYTNNSIPNFIIRCTDINGKPLEGLSSKSDPQPYPKQAGIPGTNPIKHFAEAYFEEKIKAEPENLVNYILLSQTFLRNQKTFEARKVIQAALKKYPDNSLLRFEMIQCLIKEGNRTLLSQEIERLKETDPDCYLVYKLNVDRLIDEEKYDEAQELYEKMTALYAEDQDDLKDRIRILGAKEKMEEAVKVMQDAYKKYPDNLTFVNMIFNLQKNAYKNREEAVKIYQKYLKSNFNYQVFKGLGQEYIDQGKKEKGLQIMKEIQEMFPFDADFMAGMATYYFQQQDYKKALEYCELSLSLAPYVATYWNNKAVVQEQIGDMEAAVTNYRKALYFDSRLYETRKKIRAIEKKPELYKTFPETDFYELIKKSYGETKSKQDYDYSYLLDEKLAIVYNEGAVEEYLTMVLKINTEKGIDTWKESYIPYNEYSQTLLIEKAEIVKKNGNKLQAEKNGNEIVFTSLEAGDAIIIKYRIQNYTRGRLGKDFWDRYTFNSFNPSGTIRYCLLVDKNVKPEFKILNSDLKPATKDENDFTLYTWQVVNPEPTKDEPYMPSLTDIGSSLHMSTIKSWNDVAQWYSDISYAKTEDEYELKDVFDELFSKNEKLTDIARARRIYEYIQKNIRYSSVSFRQSAYVPQKASVTINTRLGDCKDLSSLFVSLASMAGLHANLVLVDTKDNGTKEMILPSVEFNHCIVLLKAGGKEYYLELTDNNLPFGSLPNNLPGASSLIIPRQGEDVFTSSLQPLPAVNKTRDIVRRVVTTEVNGTDLKIQVEVKKTGALTSSARSEYLNLSDEKMREQMEEAVSSGYKNPVKVENVNFTGLDELADSIIYKYTCTVKNEVAEVGDMSMFKIPFGDAVATIDNFSKDSREFPLEYWRYEDADEYETIINIRIPAGKKLIELPKTETYQFNRSTYSIQYKMTGSSVTVSRKAKLTRENISPADYPAFKDFMSKIIKAEAKYIAFK